MKSKILALLLILLTLAVVALRQRSFALGAGGWAKDSYVAYLSDTRCVYATSYLGWLRFGEFSDPSGLPKNHDPETWYIVSMYVGFPGPMLGNEDTQLGDGVHLWGLLLTCDYCSGGSLPTRVRGVAVPHSAVAALLLVYPLIVFAVAPTIRRWYPRKRRYACPKCGYSLTGNVSGKCPECGTPVPTPTETPPAGKH
ncbi:MAG: hypothetical protein PVJ57_23155 [Phycisphaerae bacterium]|jgi:hypothetical protein